MTAGKSAASLCCNAVEIDWSRFTGRPPLSPSDLAVQHLRGRSVLITGAGGSIGSAIARAIAQAAPKRLVLLDQAEAGLSALQHDLPSHSPAHFILGDVRDATCLAHLFAADRIDTVFHAAACKHVPLLETNAFAAVSTNVLGTHTLLNAARRANVQDLVLLSTDKAADPISVLGATKRVAELLTLALTGSALQARVVRLCNVLGTAGSVVPAFTGQLLRGLPVAITHAEARRFFITVEDAVTYLLAALTLQPASLWVPLVQEQQSIASLAHFLASELHANPAGLEIRYTGLRPGNKLTEVLWSATEQAELLDGAPLGRIKTPLPSTHQVQTCMDTLASAVRDRSLPVLFRALQDLVPNYTPSETVLTQIGATVTAAAR